ncbi:MAG: hypothetical protein B6D63_04070 [Candidatus Latescibacteria bacterium 4484_7]|nr:MAG: hypothetical protein B6D63_04070 [Candidatus Latescibacteria bacterium 4484_7]
MKKDTFSIIIVPHDLKKTRTYKVPYRLFYTLLILLGIGLVVIIIFVATYGRVLLQAREAAGLEKQVEELTKRTETMGELRRNLAHMTAMNIQIKRMLGMEIDTVSTSEAGMVDRNSRGEPLSSSMNKEQALRAIPTFWPVRGYITRGFNIAGGKNGPSYHPGIDIAVDEGTPVLASASGVVSETGWDDVYGYYVEIDHGYGLKSFYGHNQRVVVKKDERVVRGQTIAYSGNTGKSSAPHLHFEITRDNVPVNPLDYLLK